jgi:hypothetical protein
MKVVMKRLLALLTATAGVAMALPVGASATQTPITINLNPTQAHATGTIVAMDWSSLTIQTGGRRMSTLSALTHAADVVTVGAYPYVYGGGHEQAGTASIGIKGPGYNGRRIGFDCSGAVGAVLAGAGVWAAGSGVPADDGVIAQLRSQHLIAPGTGTVTLYDKPGVHIFMSIDGRFFGTSDGGGGSVLNPHGGAGWLDDGAPDAATRAFKRYHLLPSVVNAPTIYGPTLTVSAPNPNLLEGLEVGERVRVTYTQRGNGTLVARAIG